MQRRPSQWFQSLPITDPIARRQALLLQAILVVMLGLVVAAMLLNVAVFGASALTPAGLGPNGVLLLCVAGALALLRAGRLQLAVGLILAALLGGMAHQLATAGLSAARGSLIIYAIPITLAAVTLGRRALIATAGASVATVLVLLLLGGGGAATAPPPVAATAGVFVLVVALCCMFLDRFGSALRQSLATAVRLAEENGALYRDAQQQRQELHVTLASIGDAVIATDDAGRITFMNAVAEQLTGWDMAAAAGRHLDTVFVIVNEQSRAPVESPVAKVLREGRVVGMANHTVLLARDGREVPIDDSGAPVRDAAGAISGVVLVFHDISERRAAERAIRASEERQRFLAQVSVSLSGSLEYAAVQTEVAALFVPQIADYALLYATEDDGHVRQVAGRHADPDRQPLLDELAERYDATGNASRSLVLEVMASGRAILTPQASDDHPRSVTDDPDLLRIYEALGPRSFMVLPLVARGQVRGALILVIAGSARSYAEGDLAFAQDVADRCALALDNARLFRGAQQAVAVREQFLSIASHELKTPLTSLSGYARLLQRRNEREQFLGPRDTRALQVITGQASRLEGLVNLLLDLSRIETGQLRIELVEVDVAALVRRLVEDLQPTLERHTIDLVGTEEPLVVPGDELRLEQVVQNLLQNAVKYSPAGGTVLVEMARRDGNALLLVRDEGIGIPQDALPQLFGRFYRAPNADTQHISGTGVGLYVVREIVTRHGGAVTVESVEGQGATFTVSLPLAQGAPDALDPT